MIKAEHSTQSPDGQLSETENGTVTIWDSVKYGTKLLIASAAAVSVAVYGGLKIGDAIEADKEKNQKQDAALEKAIKPTAVEIAQFAIDNATDEPFVYEGTYQYSLGSIDDGHTTIDVVVRKVDGKTPSADDVTRVMITDWAAPGGDFGDTGPVSDESLSLDDDGTWVASATYDPEAPYENEINLENSYGSYEQPYVTFEQNLDTANDIVQLIQRDFESANIAE